MSHFDNSEVWAEFASLINKEAAPLSPAARAEIAPMLKDLLGPAAAVPAGRGALSTGVSAGKGVVGFAGGLTGGAIKGAGALLGRLGVGAANLLANQTAGEIGMGVVGGGATSVAAMATGAAIVGAAVAAGYIFYRAYKENLDSLEGLIANLESLDAGDENTEATINSWIKSLGVARDQMEAQAQLGSSAEQRMASANNQFLLIQQVISLLESIEQQWTGLNTTDWSLFGFGDVPDAKKKLDQVLSLFKKRLAAVEGAAQGEYEKMLQQLQSQQKQETGILGEESAQDYSSQAKEVMSLIKQIQDAHGDLPILENQEEKIGYALALGILQHRADSASVAKYGPQLDSLINSPKGLKAALRRALQSAPTKKSSLLLGLSKKAVLLKGETPSHPNRSGKIGNSPDTITSLQESINALSQKRRLGLKNLNPDGDLGPLTAAAARAVVASDPVLTKALREGKGLSLDQIGDDKYLNANPQKIYVLAETFKRLVDGDSQSGVATTTRGPQEVVYQGPPCNPEKNISDMIDSDELRNCLRSTPFYNHAGRQQTNMYDFLTGPYVGMNDDQALLHARTIFGGLRKIEWSPDELYTRTRRRGAHGA